MLTWFDDATALAEFAARIEPLRVAAEDRIGALAHFEGYCWACNGVRRMLVRSGAMLGDRPSLREGLLCEGCGLSNRGRLMHGAILDECRRLAAGPGELLLLERTSPLYTVLSRDLPGLIGSEYLGDACAPGAECDVRGHGKVRNESITALSFADASLKVVAHSDVLEHVFDYRRALRECHRVLVADGSLVFTCPFFAQRQEPLMRAEVLAGGRIVHHEKPEYHGDPLDAEGILAFWHHGWQLLDDLRAAGFREVRLGATYDVYAGFVSNNYPGGGYGLMLPIVIRARK